MDHLLVGGCVGWPAGCVGGNIEVNRSGGRCSHGTARSGGSRGDDGVVGKPDTSSQDWDIGFTVGGAAWESSVDTGSRWSGSVSERPRLE